MVFAEASCTEFAARLASRDAVPGGGGASALVGALGAALASMVGNLTTGKKKYAAYEEEIQFILKRVDITPVYFGVALLTGFLFLSKIRIGKPGLKGILWLVALGAAEFLIITLLQILNQ